MYNCEPIYWTFENHCLGHLLHVPLCHVISLTANKIVSFEVVQHTWTTIIILTVTLQLHYVTVIGRFFAEQYDATKCKSAILILLDYLYNTTFGNQVKVEF